MDSPRDGDRDGSGGTGREGEGWQEPAHLGRADGGAGDPAADPARDQDQDPQPEPSADRAGATPWQPPGWDLPSVEPDRRPDVRPEAVSTPPPEAPIPPEAPPEAPPARRGFFGRRREPGLVEQVFRREDDPVGVQAWGLSHGWVPSDGTGPEDAPLADLVRSAPVRPTKDHRPGNVIRGRGMGLDLVALDVVYASGRYLQPQWAVTAAPVLGEVPTFRLSPARLWKHGVGGMVQIPSEDPEFERRWMLLAAEDGPQVRRLAGDPDVRRLLLATDDGDEFWTSGGFLAAIRPDGHRPELIEHHTRLLTALVRALVAGI